MEVLKLYNEVSLMEQLSGETITLIHHTKTLPAIKKLVTIGDIVTLNLKIEKEFDEYLEGPPWDLCSLSDLGTLKRELVVYHRLDFNPFRVLDYYSKMVNKLLRMVEIRTQLTLNQEPLSEI